MTDAKEFNITDYDAVCEAVEKYRSEAVINAAAYTEVDKAENKPKIAHLVNCEGPKNLALAAKKRMLG